MRVKFLVVILLLIVSCVNSSQPKESRFQVSYIDIFTSPVFNWSHSDKITESTILISGDGTWKFTQTRPTYYSEVAHIEWPYFVHLLNELESLGELKESYGLHYGASDILTVEWDGFRGRQKFKIDAYDQKAPELFYHYLSLLLEIKNQSKLINVDAEKLAFHHRVNTSLIKKQTFGEGKLSCSEKNSSCTCPEGYTITKNKTCLPNICYYVTSGVFIEDVFYEGYSFCLYAVEDLEVNFCEKMENPSRDICYLAYVSRTNDTETCNLVEDQYLKNECTN